MARIITIGMGIVFTFGAAVQYNDPDPFRWAGIYLIAAAFSFLSLRNVLPWWLYATSSTIAIAWAGVVALGVDAAAYRGIIGEFAMASLDIEEAREALGLIMIGLWMGVLAVRIRLSKRRKAA